MASHFKLSKYVFALKRKNTVILWNSILGGCAVVSLDQYDKICENVIDETDFTGFELAKLEKSNILIDKDSNEESVFAHQRNTVVEEVMKCERLKTLELSVSEQCNYKCVYCTFWRNAGQKKRKYILPEVAKLAVEDFLEISKPQKRVLIYFGTAEPTLNWNVISSIAPLARRIRPDVVLSLITNGSLITKDNLEFCKEYGIKVGISLDGKPETQRRQRVPISNSIDSSAVIKNLLRVGREIDFKFSCLSATYRDVGFKKDIDYLIPLCRENGIKEFDLDFDVNGLNEANMEVVLSELLYGYKKTIEFGLDIFGYWLIPFFNIIKGGTDLKSFCGNVVGESVCVSSDGGFKLCGYETSNIFDYTSLRSHLQSIEFKSICEDRLLGLNPQCNVCMIEGLCNGHCFLINHDSESWTQACHFYQLATKKLLANYA
ncbi:MAG: radical SAM protein [Patescibacteria group bacterium]